MDKQPGRFGTMTELARRIDLLARRLADPADRSSLDEPDRELIEEVVGPLLHLLQRYFQFELRGMERVPPSPALLVGNHNAGITFFEPVLLGHAWWEHTHGDDPLYFLAHDVMMKLPMLGPLLSRVGVLRASRDTAQQALAAGHKVVVFPGGNHEAFRPYAQRHRVDFGGKLGYVRAAVQARVPIVPMLCWGGQDTFVVLHRGEWIAKLLGVDRALRSESFPIFLGLPWGFGIGPIFHLPPPVKLIVEFADPIDTSSLSIDAACDEVALRALADRVEATIQQMMYRYADAQQRRSPNVP